VAHRPRTAPPSVDSRLLALTQDRILTWYGANARDLPWRRSTDPYAILVSETMLQQTQVPRVAQRYVVWMARFPDLETLTAAPLADALACWQGLGYNTRARRLREAAMLAVSASPADRPAALPRTLEGLLALPGVGPYTARAVLVFAHNQDVAAVDINVRRVLTHELALPPDLDDAQLQAIANAAVPPGRSRDWHNALMDYGSLVLTAAATGIAPHRRQGAFEGSRRQRRAALLRTLLERHPQSIAELAAALGRDASEIDALVELLRRDGLVRGDSAGITLA